jgi:hypothetical protein
LVGDVAAGHPGIAAPAADHFHPVVGSAGWALSIRRHTDCGVSEQGCNAVDELGLNDDAAAVGREAMAELARDS